MNKDYTHIAIVIDRSGSMQSSWTDVVGGYSQIVRDQKAQPGKCTFTVAAFDTQYDLVEDFTDIQEVDEVLKVTPRGGTALLDSIGKTINSVGEKLAKLKEKNRPAKVIVMVQTDGEENSSHEFTKESVKALIENQTNKYNWQFMFIGASLDSVRDAQAFGFNASNTSCYNTRSSGQTLGVLSEKMSNMRGVSDPTLYASTMMFTEAEKDIMNDKVSKNSTLVTK